MRKLIAFLAAGTFAGAAFGQAPAPTSQPETSKAEASKPVKAKIRPEPDVAGAADTDAKATGETQKVKKHKKPKAHKKAAKSEPAAETK